MITIKIIRGAEETYKDVLNRAKIAASEQLGRGVKYCRVRRVRTNGKNGQGIYRIKVALVSNGK